MNIVTINTGVYFRPLYTDKPPPTLPALLCLKVHEQVDGKYQHFGTMLLNDTTGSLVDSIEKSQHTPEEIVIGILKKWLQGTGMPVTWQSLITSLENSGHRTLASAIKEKLDKAAE